MCVQFGYGEWRGVLSLQHSVDYDPSDRQWRVGRVVYEKQTNKLRFRAAVLYEASEETDRFRIQQTETSILEPTISGYK